MIPEYKYQCIDHSIITPHFKKFIVHPLIRFIPRGLPANFITILSNVFLYIAVYLTVSCGTYSSNYYIIPFLIFCYAVGDHLDGMQAKRTNTSSALGEFCDHYLDVFNNGILLYILIVLYNVQNPLVISFLFLSAYLPHASVIYEEFKTGWLVFEAFGSLECVFFIMILLLLGVFEPVLKFFQMKTFLNLSLIESVMLLSGIGTIGTLLKTYLRVKHFSAGFMLYAVCSVFIAYFCFIYATVTMTFLFITFYNGDYMGKLMRGHLADGRERYPDIIMPVMLAVVIVSHMTIFHGRIVPEFVFYAAFIYLAARVFLTTVSTVYILREYIYLWNRE